jgi:hypothetical protein
VNAISKIEPTAAVVLFESEKFNAFYAKLKADIDAVPVDLTTDKGRKAIASAAAKVRTEKASIDRDRKRLTQEWRDMTAQVNGAWKSIETQLDELAVEARRPLTEWEDAEKERLDRCNEVISDIHGAAIVTLDDTAETVRLRGMRIWAIEIGDDFQALKSEAEQAKSATISTLQAALARLKREEAERAELEKLRAEAVERERIEADKRAAEELAQREAEAEQRRKDEAAAAEKAKADREAEIAAQAEQRAKDDAERAAQVERDRVQREHDEAIAAERRRAEEAEAAMQAERDRVAKVEADRQAATAAEAAEQARRDKNRAHRSQIMGEAKIAIMAAGKALHEDAAVAIVKAIVAGQIPHVTLRF